MAIWEQRWHPLREEWVVVAGTGLTPARRYSSARHQSAKRRIPSSMLTFGA